MRLDQRSETFSPGEDHTWLGSAHATDTFESITLDGDSFLTDFTDGVIPSGVVLGKVTATGLYRQYDDAAVDGTEVAAGFLGTTKDLGGTTAATVGNTPAALMWHGQVIVANLPTNHGLDAAARVDLAHIHFIG